MGMYLAYCTLSDENISRLLKDPPLVNRVVAPDDPEAYFDEFPSSPNFFARLFGKNRPKPAGELPVFTYREGEGVHGDLDKSWHAIQYLLTGTAWEGEDPLNFLLHGKEVGKVDLGYGPARVHPAAETTAINDALKEIDREVLKSRFDPEDMMSKEIYPEIWDRPPEEDDTLDYCLTYFDELKQFIANAEKQDLGLLIYIG